MIPTAFRILLLTLILVLAAQRIRMSTAQEAPAKPQGKTEAQPEAQPGETQPYYTQLTEGMIASPAFPYQFTSAKLRLEIRNLVMGHSKAPDVPTPTDILMELRGGLVITSINGQSEERIQGDFWTVAKGSKLSIESPGPVAVIRAIYVYPGSK